MTMSKKGALEPKKHILISTHVLTMAGEFRPLKPYNLTMLAYIL